MRILFTLTFLINFSLNGFSSDFRNTTKLDRAQLTSAFIMDTSFVYVADTVLLQISNCSDLAQLCVNLPVASIPNYQFSANGAPYGLSLAPCDPDTIIRYSYTNLDEPGPYRLDSWLINNIEQASANIFNNGDELTALMNLIDPTGNWVNDSVNKIISGGTEGSIYTQMQVFQLNDLITQTLFFSEFYFANGTNLNFPQGFTEFVITETLTGLSDTFNVQVACVQNDTLNLSLLISDSSVVCLDFSELIGEVDTVFNICAVGS